MPGGPATTTTTTTETNSINCKAMSFVRETLHLLLRYVAMVVLLVYHTGEKILLALTGPLQPVTAEARKVPKSEITIQGIFRTFMRFLLLAGLYCWTAVSGFVKYLFRPVESIVESAKAIVNNEAPNWEKAQ
ncbi:uncharacterized protein LOC121385326 isoform X2 [Gigantopelta aegis]|nr:uncharacterized protein LOC121385326 isoform X2 [Gigantopelta aegis]